MSWHESLGIVFSGMSRSANRPGLFRVNSDGSNLETLMLLDEAELREALSWASVLPNGAGVLFTRDHAGDYGRSTIEVFSIDERSTRVLTRGLRPRFFSTGHVIFSRDGKLFALPFDEAALEATGPPQIVMEGLPIDGINGDSSFTLSREGDLAYISGSNSMLDRPNLLWVASDGASTSTDAPGRQYADPRISPDGTKLAFSIPSDGNEVWVHDFDRQTQTRLTFAEGEDETPVWSPDGIWLAFSSSRKDRERTISRRRADGSGSEELLWEGPPHTHVSGWTPDGKTLIFDASTGGETGTDIWALDVEGDHKPRTLLGNPYNEFHSRLSPDGKWLAYTSTESNRSEIYVQRYPELDRKIQISNDGGMQPVWSSDGRKLFYRRLARMMVVEVSAGGTNPFSRPELVFEKEFGLGKASNHFGYDVAADGRFLMTVPDSELYPREIALVVAWDRELMLRFSN